MSCRETEQLEVGKETIGPTLMIRAASTTATAATLDTKRAAWMAMLANPLFADRNSSVETTRGLSLETILPTNDRRAVPVKNYPTTPFAPADEPVDRPAWSSHRAVQDLRAIQPRICDPLFADFDELMSGECK